jgi:hypothetical protein
MVAISTVATNNTTNTRVRALAPASVQISIPDLVLVVVQVVVARVIQIPAERRFWEKVRFQGIPARSHGRLSLNHVTTA